jgi:hypothetical protein
MANAAIIRGIRRKIIEFIRGLSAPPEHRRGRSGIFVSWNRRGSFRPKFPGRGTEQADIMRRSVRQPVSQHFQKSIKKKNFLPTLQCGGV